MAAAFNETADSYRDDGSSISLESITNTESTAILPPPSYSSLSFPNASSTIVEQIIGYLELEKDDKKDEIISDILKNGRQALFNYTNDIIPDLLSQEKSFKSKDESPLLKLIKQNITETYERLLVSQPTIISFIHDTKNENSVHFNNVLNRMAEYGSIYTDESFILSFVLQLLFESMDDECVIQKQTFEELWNTITIQGIQSIKKFIDYIPEVILEEQTKDKKSALYSALRMYYEKEATSLFKQLQIPNRKNTLYDLAIDNVVDNGWLQGIQSIRTSVAGKQYQLLIKSIEGLISKQLPDLKHEALPEQYTAECTNSMASNSSPSMLCPTSTSDAAHSIDAKHDHTLLNSNTTGSTKPNPSSSSPTNDKQSQQMKSDDFKEEIDIAMKCIKRNSLTLEDLVEAGELCYKNKTLKDISNDLILKLQKHNSNLTMFIQNCLTPIMFLLKRQQNLDDFIKILTDIFEDAKYDQTISTTLRLNLRRFLHVLMMNSDIFLQRIIISLIGKRNPIPFLEPNIGSLSTDSNNNNNDNTKYEFVSSIIHIWDHTRPTILSFGIGNDCRGKSTLLNVLFQSTFEQSEKSIYFQETIDIDFGYSFNPERQLNIADCHGQMSIELFTKIRSLFDGYLIHVNMKYWKEHSKTILDYLELIQKKKFYFILIRDIDPSDSVTLQSQCQTLIDSSDSIINRRLSIFPIVNVSNITDKEIQRIIQRLRNQILKSVDTQKEDLIETDIFKNTIEKILNKNYIFYLHDIDEIIQPLKTRLLNKYSDAPVQQNFPLYLKFIKLCQLSLKLKKIDFYGSKSDDKFNVNQEIFQLENISSNDLNSVGHVFESFIKILRTDNMLMSLNLLQTELRQMLLNYGGDKLANNLSVTKSFLSLEVIWRNAIVCYKHASKSDQKTILKNYIEYIKAGFPFEIIDGDHFYFQYEFLNEIMNSFGENRILVISIIGPQNSGKSTLLNYMFGTLFEVREGRCTRGVYGSFVKCNNISNIDYILLIDTEGLLSIEKSDKEYDRRLVLFSLAISHLMIVNMLGDMNETVKDMLTLCTDSLKQLDVGKVPKPTVHFVFNQKADPNIKNHSESVDKIVADVKDQGLAETISIGTETFHTLPSAYKKERLQNETTGPCLIRTEPDFIELTQKLLSKFIQSAEKHYDQGETANFTPCQWLNTSNTIFEMLQRFPDLTYFKNINEKQQDDRIRKQIEQLLSNTLSATYRQTLIDEHCHKNEQDIKRSFQSKFHDHQEKFQEELENVFKIENASERIRDRCQQFLQRQVTEMRNAWCLSAIQASDRERMELLVRDGADDLKLLIDDIIKKGEVLTKEKAVKVFEERWEEKLKFIKNNFNPEERLKQAIQYVYGNYNIFERTSLPTLHHILKMLRENEKITKLRRSEEVREELKTHFKSDVAILQERVIMQPNDSKFTLSTIENFIFLNKTLLYDKLQAVIDSQEPTNIKINENNRNFLRWGYDKVKKWLLEKKPGSIETEPLDTNIKQIMKEAIKSEIIGDPFHVSNVLQLTVFFDKSYKELFDLIFEQEIARPIEIEIIQKVVGSINAYIKEINRELSVFELALSKNVSSAIHSSVVLFLTVLYFNEQKFHFDKQLETLEVKKARLLNFFISMVVPDAATDKEAGKIFINQYLQIIKEGLTEKAYGLIEKEYILIQNPREKEQNLSRKALQKICDGKLAAANERWVLKYIRNSTDIIVEEFNIKWDGIKQRIEDEINTEKIHLKKQIYDLFEILKYMSSALLGEGSAVQFIHDLFTSSAGDADENLKNKGQCMTLLFFAYLTNEKIESKTSYKISNSNYIITDKGVRFFQKLSKPNQNVATWMNKLKLKSTITPIKNFQVFLNSMLDFEQEARAIFEKIPTTFVSYDKDKVYLKLLAKAQGCTAKCPCCQRQCDAEHTTLSNPGDEDNKHSCSTGHQLRAFTGIKLEINDEASLYQCHEINDNDIIVVKGTREKWSKMKLRYSEWDFDLKPEENHVNTLKSKFLFVWSKVGKEFCNQFNMTFVTMNTPKLALESFHYVLLLDSSTSMMKDDRWQNLLAGVNELITARQTNGSDDRITIITFSDTAYIVCSNITMKDTNISNIKLSGGSTNFGAAFKLVTTTMESGAMKKTNLKHIIVFMSDGEASYPENELNSLADKVNDQIKEFWTVALGEGRMDILEKINNRMNGTYKQLQDASELIQVYAEIAQ